MKNKQKEQKLRKKNASTRESSSVTRILEKHRASSFTDGNVTGTEEYKEFVELTMVLERDKAIKTLSKNGASIKVSFPPLLTQKECSELTSRINKILENPLLKMWGR